MNLEIVIFVASPSFGENSYVSAIQIVRKFPNNSLWIFYFFYLFQLIDDAVPYGSRVHE